MMGYENRPRLWHWPESKKGTLWRGADPAYLAAMHPGSLVRHPLSREQYLSWNFLPDRLLDAVVGIRAGLNSVEMTRLANELELIGWSVHREGGGFRAEGPDAKLEVIPAGSRPGGATGK